MSPDEPVPYVNAACTLPHLARENPNPPPSVHSSSLCPAFAGSDAIAGGNAWNRRQRRILHRPFTIIPDGIPTRHELGYKGGWAMRHWPRAALFVLIVTASIPVALPADGVGGTQELRTAWALFEQGNEAQAIESLLASSSRDAPLYQAYAALMRYAGHCTEVGGSLETIRKNRAALQRAYEQDDDVAGFALLLADSADKAPGSDSISSLQRLGEHGHLLALILLSSRGALRGDQHTDLDPAQTRAFCAAVRDKVQQGQFWYLGFSDVACPESAGEDAWLLSEKIGEQVAARRSPAGLYVYGAKLVASSSEPDQERGLNALIEASALRCERAKKRVALECVPGFEPRRKLRVCTALAESGDVAASVELGKQMQYGTLVPRDVAAAAQRYQAAADSGDAEGAYQLARVYDWGLLGQRDATKARQLYEQAAKAGSQKAEARLATSLLDGTFGQINTATGIWELVSAVKKGNSVARFWLDRLCLDYTDWVSTPEVRKWSEQATRGGERICSSFFDSTWCVRSLGDPDCMLAQAIQDMPTARSSADAAKAAKIEQDLTRAAELGSPEAAYDLAQWRLNATWKPPLPEVHSLMERLHSATVEPDRVKLLRAASSRGFVPAQFALGAALGSEDHSRDEGLQLIRAAAQVGYYWASRFYCQSLDQETKTLFLNDLKKRIALFDPQRGTEQARTDTEGSERWNEAALFCQSAARAGDPESALDLAHAYRLAPTPPGNIGIAVLWLNSAAEDGAILALYELGEAYEAGEGVAQNFRKAAVMFRRAARSGLSLGMERLAKSFEKGAGVRQDLVRAYVWHSLAAAEYQDPSVLSARDAVAAGISQAQLEAAQTCAAELEAAIQGVITIENNELVERPWPAVNEADIREIQQGLRRLGYSVDAANGKLDPQTSEAITEFHRRIGIDDAATPTRETLIEVRCDLRIVGVSPVGRTQVPTPRAGSGKEDAGRASVRIVGTGIAVSADGVILTAAHVLENCKTVRIHHQGNDAKALVIALDRFNDLALLKGESRLADTAPLCQDDTLRVGRTVLAGGYPLQGLLSSQLNVSTGSIAADAGPRDDPRLFQMSAPVQPGNSGGPYWTQVDVCSDSL